MELSAVSVTTSCLLVQVTQRAADYRGEFKLRFIDTYDINQKNYCGSDNLL